MEPYEPERLPDRQIRIADADRDLVIDQLQLATSEGRLTFDEFQVRARATYDAQFSADLVPITADLPTPSPALVEQARSGKPRRKWLISMMGGNDRTGTWDPGDQTVALTLMGGQTLDLTQVAATEVSIVAITLMGGTEIIVPNGAIVDLAGFMVMGASSNETNRQGDSPMRVHVRVLGGMGSCEVRNLKPKEEAKRQLRDS